MITCDMKENLVICNIVVDVKGVTDGSIFKWVEKKDRCGYILFHFNLNLYFFTLFPLKGVLQQRSRQSAKLEYASRDEAYALM